MKLTILEEMVGDFYIYIDIFISFSLLYLYFCIGFIVCFMYTAVKFPLIWPYLNKTAQKWLFFFFSKGWLPWPQQYPSSTGFWSPLGHHKYHETAPV